MIFFFRHFRLLSSSPFYPFRLSVHVYVRLPLTRFETIAGVIVRTSPYSIVPTFRLRELPAQKRQYRLLNSINQLIFVMVKCGVLFEVGPNS
jgi:hypothetical protein